MASPAPSFIELTTLACRRALYVAGFFSLFINLFALVVPLYSLQLFDRVLSSHSAETLIYLTLIAIIALGIMGLIDIARSRILTHISHWLDNTLSPAALKKCPDEILQGRQYGPQALRDIATIRQFLGGAGVIALFDAPWLPIFLIVIFLLHPLLGVIATLGTILIFLLVFVNEIATNKILKAANEMGLGTQRYIDSSLYYAETIQGMGMGENIVKHWHKKNSEALKLHLIASQRAGIILSTFKFVRFGLQLVMMGVGAWLAIHNKLTAGAMIAASIMLARALSPIEQSITTWKQFISAQQAYHRLKAHFAQDSRATTTIHLPEPQGRLTVNQIFYRTIQSEKPILYGLSFNLMPGDLLAVLGASGAGKSTLARLIIGALKPTAGDIRLDGADVYTFNREELGRHVGYMSQEIELFPGTIKDNIARMGEVDDRAVITAAKLANVHEIILKLPRGYDTFIDNTGSFVLSGGQRQRIALARALYQNPRLLVLDEPNANLDTEGEAALVQAILSMKTQKTTQVIITHRPMLLDHVDYIIVLKDGQPQMMGKREQVLEELKKLSSTNKQIKPASSHEQD